MKRLALLFLTGILLGPFFAGTEEVNAADETPVIAVSNYPLKFFVERLAPVRVNILFPAGTAPDPAYWKPDAAQTGRMQKADWVILNGAEYEKWLIEVSLRPSRVVDTSAGFRDRWIKFKETFTHSHGPEGKHEHTGVSFTTWLDPELALQQADVIRRKFQTIWPQHVREIDRNYHRLKEDLERINTDIADIIALDPAKPVLFSHPIYQYFARRYHINGKSVHFEPDVMPDQKAWDHLQDILKTHPAQWMIWEAEPSDEIQQKLARLGIRCIVFDPAALAPAKGDYLTAMRGNIDRLKRVYQASPVP